MPGGMGGMGGMPGGGGGGAADIPEEKEQSEIELPETIPDHVQDTPDDDLYQRVVESLREIYDPEIPVNIYDLGLIYHLESTTLGSSTTWMWVRTATWTC